MSDVPKPAPFLTIGQIAITAIAVLAVVASVVALAVVAPPSLKEADPDRPVSAYLHAIVAGDISKALTIGRVKPAKGDRLLTDAAYGQSSDRITAFTIAGTELDGDKGTVQARLTQGGRSLTAVFAVERAPGFPLLAPWRLAVQRLPQISASFDASVGLLVKVAGVTLTPSQGVVTQHVFPGAYEIDPVGSTLFDASGTTAAASFGSAPQPSVMAVSLTDEGRATADDEVAGWITQCAASTDMAPAGCPFMATPEPSTTYSDGRWAIQSQPQLTTGSWNSELKGWPVTTSVPGYITFSAKARQGNLVGTATTGSKPFAVAGTMVPDSSGLRFVPSPAYSSGSAGALT